MANLAWPHAAHWNRLLTNSSTGAALASTAYNIYLSDGTTLATIYTDRARTSTRSQPLTTDAAGNAGFFADPYAGLILSVSGQTEVIDVLPDVADLTGAIFTSDGGVNTTYLLSGSDNLKQLGFLAGGTSGSTLAITVPNTLPLNWSCEVYQEGLGTITYTAASGASLESLGVASSSVVHHPGWKGWTRLQCRYNNSGTQAVVTIANGIT